jgi:hypothetical protein
MSLRHIKINGLCVIERYNIYEQNVHINILLIYLNKCEIYHTLL